MNKVLNPFFSTGKMLGKFFKYSGLAMAGAAGVAAIDLFPAYADVLVGAVGGVPGMILGAILPILLAGAGGAVRNWQKNNTVTPEELAAILASAEAKKVAMKYSFTTKELNELIVKATRLAKK